MIKRICVDPVIKNKKDIIDPPIIIRLNQFNAEDVSKFSESFSNAHDTGQPIIPIVVDSYGGSVYGLLTIISEIQSSQLPVATICEGKAMSAGAILFGLGTRGYRYMSPHSCLMIHDVSSFTFGKVEEIKADAKEVDRLNTLIFQLLAKHCNKDKDFFLDIIHQKSHAEWFLEPKEAKRHNLCDKIKIPELIVNISVSMEIK